MGAYVELWAQGGRERIALEGSNVSIGQAQSNEVSLPSDPTVSRLHAVLENLTPGWCIRDLNSRNGTYLNGERIWGEHPLRPGDEIRIGQTKLVFRVDAPVEIGSATVGAGEAPEVTRRERDVLIALCVTLVSGEPFREPASIREIARELFVTEAAVKQHLGRLYDKFGVGEQGERRRVRLANEAVRRGAVTMAEIQQRAKDGGVR